MKAVRVDDIGVFPAHAGVILGMALGGPVGAGFPRTRGGDPFRAAGSSVTGVFSPHTRG